jgi:predicted nucleic acid-binding protein
MIIIVDTNIIISACLNKQSDLFNLLKSSDRKINFVLPEYALEEINNHKVRVCYKSKVDLNLFNENLFDLIRFMNLLSYKELNKEIIEKANELTEDIDKKDTIFVAFSLALDSLLWSSDLKLYKALRRKSFNNIITTKELKQIIKGIT